MIKFFILSFWFLFSLNGYSQDFPESEYADVTQTWNGEPTDNIKDRRVEIPALAKEGHQFELPLDGASVNTSPLFRFNSRGPQWGSIAEDFIDTNMDPNEASFKWELSDTMRAIEEGLCTYKSDQEVINSESLTSSDISDDSPDYSEYTWTALKTGEGRETEIYLLTYMLSVSLTVNGSESECYVPFEVYAFVNINPEGDTDLESINYLGILTDF